MDEQCPKHSAVERAINQHDKRLDKHSQEMDQMRECIARLTALQESDSEWRKDADARIDALEQKPARRWDSAVDKAVLAVIAGVVGFALAQMGIS